MRATSKWISSAFFVSLLLSCSDTPETVLCSEVFRKSFPEISSQVSQFKTREEQQPPVSYYDATVRYREAEALLVKARDLWNQSRNDSNCSLEPGMQTLYPYSEVSSLIYYLINYMSDYERKY